MLTWEQWHEKSKSSLEASRILLEHDMPVEAISRAYYAVFQMVTGMLIKLKLNPREEYGNWSHQETQKMYRIHLCQKADLGFKEKQALKNQISNFRALLETRYLADYGIPSKKALNLAKTYWRNANKLVSLLNSLRRRGLL